MKPLEFLEAYNGLRAQSGVPLYGLGLDKNIRSSERYLKWCEKNDVEPVLYLKSYVDWSTRAGRDFPKLGFLRSKRGLEIWQRFAEGHALAGRADERLTKEMEQRPQPAIKIRPWQERFKSFYVGNRGMCARYVQHTGGYNPESAHCDGCTEVASCKKLST